MDMGVLDEIDKPKHTLYELYECLYWDEDLPVTFRQLYQAVLDGELVPTKFSNKNYFSLRDGLDWVAAQKGKAARPEKPICPLNSLPPPDGQIQGRLPT